MSVHSVFFLVRVVHVVHVGLGNGFICSLFFWGLQLLLWGFDGFAQRGELRSSKLCFLPLLGMEYIYQAGGYGRMV